MNTSDYHIDPEVRKILPRLYDLESIAWLYLDESNEWTNEQAESDRNRIEEIIALATQLGCVRKHSHGHAVDMFVFPAYDENGNKVMLDPTNSLEADPVIVEETELLRLIKDAA